MKVTMTKSPLRLTESEREIIRLRRAMQTNRENAARAAKCLSDIELKFSRQVNEWVKAGVP